ncbi:Mss4-like protein [Dichotomopilus funicola]|uniref:Mss4-like protein n=1 Tax=Dichotomopilus funicola TaxID=1934379 RepID=A0AAN6V0E2_9PEZI|nr:Mss4-like protein [Dichotomopilus funicola]
MEDLHDLHLPHQLPTSTKTLTARCHCRTIHFTITLPTSALPLPVHLCNCSICRYTHGTLSCFHAPLPKGIQPSFLPPSSLESAATGYIHSPLAAATRFFCKTCGCHIGDRDHDLDPETGLPEWRVATSIFEPTHDPDNFQIRSHVFAPKVSDDADPGMATWVPEIAGRKMHVWNPSQEEAEKYFPLAEVGPADPDPRGEVGEDEVVVQCHCAGVRFVMPRPEKGGEEGHELFRRFLQPRQRVVTTSGTEVEAEAGHHQEARLNRAACICLCADCRLTTGAHAVAWTFAPLSSLRPTIPSTFTGFGTLQAYASSPNVRRGFCNTCGATVFFSVDGLEERVYQGDGEKGRVVDVAVGLIREKDRSKKGVGLEDWVTWRTGRLAGPDTGRKFDEAFFEGLEKGLGEWGERRYGERIDYEVP